MPLINPVEVLKNPEAIDGFLRALSTLYSTGVLEFLRERGRVYPISDTHPNFIAAQAARANWSLGYNNALDDLVNFKEYFLGVPTAERRAPANFGSIERAVQNGDLTLEEAEALQDGKPIPELRRESIPESVTVRK